MPRKNAPKGDKTRDLEQYKRFLETAREVEAEEDPKAFDKAFRKVAKSHVSQRKETARSVKRRQG